jgi:Tol biopolymer transport system component
MNHQSAIAVLACLLATAVAIAATPSQTASRSAAGDKFVVASERPVLEVPGLYRPSQSLSFAALSPDGRSVLIVKAGRLTIRPLESWEEKQLLPQGSVATVGNEAWTAWSADGKFIYYLRLTDRAGITDLWRLDIDTRKQKRLIENAGGVITAMPQPSPDGKSIAFFRGKTLMLAATDGQSERVLWQDGEATKWPGVTWSPDSSQILAPAFSGGFLKLNLLTVATGQAQRLPPVRGRILSMIWPSWSSGPFLCGFVLPSGMNGDFLPVRQIWHLSLPQNELTQVTTDPLGYSKIFGAGTGGVTRWSSSGCLRGPVYGK